MFIAQTFDSQQLEQMLIVLMLILLHIFLPLEALNSLGIFLGTRNVRLFVEVFLELIVFLFTVLSILNEN